MDNHAQRIQTRYDDYFRRNACRVDLLFAVLMLVQLVAGVLGALLLTPKTWAGSTSDIHIHVWASLIMGVMIAAAPLYMIWRHRGEVMTRYTVGVAQMLFSVLLIHISGGRIETHFHVFGSLAFLAFYRDWRVYIPATIVVTADHLLRGIFWPESVFGVLTSSPWRAFEHAGWVLFENTFLISSCLISAHEMRKMATAQVELEETNERIEDNIRLRTKQLQSSNTALRLSDERYGLVIQGTREAVWDWDLCTNRVYYAPNWYTLLGMPPNQDADDTPDTWFGRVTSRNLTDFQGKLNHYLNGESDRFELEVEMSHTNGSTRWMMCRATASRDPHGVAKRITGSLSDITELKEAQGKLRRMAEFDQLTDLPNRQLFHQKLSLAINDRRMSGGDFSVVFFDFDRFKVINDSLGHNTGDALLKQIAERFRSQLRAHDTAARFGGDEFVLLLRDIKGVDEADEICKQMLKLFAQPYQIDGHSIVSTASIGLVMSSDLYTKPEDMVRDADAAMYRAKSAGRNRLQVFDSEMHHEAMDRLTLEHELRLAIDAGQMEVHYQPIVSSIDGVITGFEALLRWNHPDRGQITPNQFIPLAEETGIIVELGEWVFRQACMQLCDWLRLIENDRGFTLTVNISRRQIIHPSIIDDLRTILNQTGAPPHRMCLEITESTIMDERQGTTRIIKQIKGLGVNLALDDFGTGHSSLSCLHRFPIDVLKIDQSFIRHLSESSAFSAVLNSIVSLGHHLNMKIVGEGIETLDQLVHLQALDCEWAQGYYFAKPMKVGDATKLLQSSPQWDLAA